MTRRVYTWLSHVSADIVYSTGVDGNGYGIRTYWVPTAYGSGRRLASPCSLADGVLWVAEGTLPKPTINPGET